MEQFLLSLIIVLVVLLCMIKLQFCYISLEKGLQDDSQLAP